MAEFLEIAALPASGTISFRLTITYPLIKPGINQTNLATNFLISHHCATIAYYSFWLVFARNCKRSRGLSRGISDRLYSNCQYSSGYSAKRAISGTGLAERDKSNTPCRSHLPSKIRSPSFARFRLWSSEKQRDADTPSLAPPSSSSDDPLSAESPACLPRYTLPLVPNSTCRT